ncbi:GvpL/GvpF family gas vesicle protein [Streptomyces purpureus]|uniref:Gas vesicle protein n=1 Tax=Streptomyces purpureus TaxID=1951 RepID=A0A918GX35_9ACTN|nr:GvpL/GvpF family gas vesicle protein [Streptomyces purpureus]GGT15733.1 gas vesicle protein [Streptomyces purpureus]
MTVYVYAITGAGHPCRLDGLSGVGADPSGVRTVTADALRAVVSDVREEPRPKRRDLTAHQEVQDRLMADGTALPLRFGYTAPDDDAVRAVLEDRGQEYLAILERLDGSAEFHLRVAQAEESLLREILEESREARELNDAIIHGDPDPRAKLALGEFVAQEVASRRTARAEAVVNALAPSAREHEVLTPSGDDLLSVSFLVAEAEREAFLAKEAELAAAADDGVEFRLTGPLPPYSFV